jgi:hypothetical protein
MKIKLSSRHNTQTMDCSFDFFMLVVQISLESSFNTIYDNVEINPTFPSGYFEGIPTAEVASTELGLMPSPAMAEIS